MSTERISIAGRAFEVRSVVLKGDARYGNEILLESCVQRDGAVRWAIRERGFCLSQDGQWVYEPLPSSRSETFLEECRFSTAARAVEAWRSAERRNAG